MLFPGLAYYKTIEQNHKRSISSAGTFNKNCKSGVLKNNPVYEDLKQVVDLCPPVFSICIMLDEKGKIIAAKSGNIISAHKAVSELVNKKYRIKIKAKSDLVICSAGGYPKDINLIQTNKTIYNSYQAVKPGGVIICLAECPEGIGSKTFLNWFGYDKAALKKNLLKNYSLNAQTALSVIEKSKSVRIILVSKLDPELVKKMGMTPAKNIESAFNEAKNYLKKYSYYVIKNCSSVVPYL
jgi:nickel-dependent lactate racemase